MKIYDNLRDAVKTVVKGKSIAFSAYKKKEKKCKVSDLRISSKKL